MIIKENPLITLGILLQKCSVGLISYVSTMNISNKGIADDTSVLVLSCDNYFDVWPPFSKCWDMFWPDCPFVTYLVSEQKEFSHNRIRNMRTGKKMGWGRMMLDALSKVQSRYILYLQEDYLLRSRVDTKKLFDLLDIFENENAAYLRLLPWPGPDEPHPKYPQLGLLKPDSKYRTSLQAAFWRKDVLEQLVDAKDDGRFESWSIKRAESISRQFLCLNRNGINDDINHDGDYPLNYFATSVFQGKWLKEALRLYKSLGVEIDTSHRGAMNRLDFLEYRARKHGTNSIKYKLIYFLQCSFNKIRSLGC